MQCGCFPSSPRTVRLTVCLWCLATVPAYPSPFRASRRSLVVETLAQVGRAARCAPSPPPRRVLTCLSPSFAWYTRNETSSSFCWALAAVSAELHHAARLCSTHPA